MAITVILLRAISYIYTNTAITILIVGINGLMWYMRAHIHSVTHK